MIDGLERDIKKRVKIHKSTRIVEVDLKNKKIRFENVKGNEVKTRIENFDIIINTYLFQNF